MQPDHCQFCGREIRPGDTIVACPACHRVHHDSCWHENGGCATTGCGVIAQQQPAGARQRSRLTWLVVAIAVAAAASAVVLTYPMVEKAMAWSQVEGLTRSYHYTGIFGSVTDELSYWRFPVKTYYNQTGLTEAQIYADARADSSSKDRISAKILSLDPVTWDRAHARFKVRLKYEYHWVLRRKHKDVTGIDDVTLDWQKGPDGWKIVESWEAPQHK